MYKTYLISLISIIFGVIILTFASYGIYYGAYHNDYNMTNGCPLSGCDPNNNLLCPIDHLIICFFIYVFGFLGSIIGIILTGLIIFCWHNEDEQLNVQYIDDLLIELNNIDN